LRLIRLGALAPYETARVTAGRGLPTPPGETGKYRSSVVSDKRAQFETIFKKFKAIFPHLGNENEGEALSALRAINKLLKNARLD
jgi:hypothetical protein